MNRSILLNSDSYKYSMVHQYPKGTEYVYSYIESRGGRWDKTVFFGLQAYIIENLLKRISIWDIDEADEIITSHGEPFYREGWEYILRKKNGILPVRIKAVAEGSVVPTKNVLLTIENTDPNCWWLTTFLETSLLRSIWYSTTVATNSYTSKKIINYYLELTGTPETIDFRLHDFGARGVSSFESAGIGGLAHLVNFKGTDNITALLFAKDYYNANMAGFSVPAMEHSTVTSWGRENEIESYRNMIKQFGGKDKIVSIVSDSYNIFEACKSFGTELKEEIIKSGTTLVVRPDSGEPMLIVRECLRILDEYFGHTINEKGYKVLNNVRVLQGDGITWQEIDNILDLAIEDGYSADNIIFGQGGGLLQQLDRDTQKFAMKCSAICVNGKWRDVYKEPFTDKGKESKKGRVSLYKDENGNYISAIENGMKSELETIFEDGKLLKKFTLDEVRKNASET